MEIKYMMLNQRVVPVEPFEAVSIGGRFDGGDLFKTGKYSCSSCGKDEWFFCPDQYAPFLACHTLSCMINDRESSKGKDNEMVRSYRKIRQDGR